MEHSTVEPSSIEERLQPWIDQGEYIILLTIIIMTWAGGWVDILAFESFDGVIFGRYSVPIFAFLLVYSLGFVFWLWLIISLPALERMKQVISFFQRKPIFFLLLVIGMIAVIWSMLVIDWWSTFSLLQINALVIMCIFCLLVLLAKPTPDEPFHLWRKVSVAILVILLLIEAVLQGMAYLKILPFDTLSGLNIPYGRVYQSEQGFANDQTNSNGWYYPDFRLEEGSYRIAINGDTYVAALQIPQEAHFAQSLEMMFNEGNTSSTPTEVMAQGQLGYGAEMYLSNLIYPSIWEPLELDEIVIVFNLANDFSLDRGAIEPVVYLSRGVVPYVDIEDFEAWHIDAHITVEGHDAPNPVRTIYSNSLLMNAITLVLGGDLSRVQPLDTATSNVDAPFGDASLLFNTQDNAGAEQIIDYVALELEVFNQYMADHDIEVRLVTLPYFPAEFYETYEGTNWDTLIGEYDLLLPDARLQAVAEANGIPFLSIGQLMQAENIAVEEIQSLFFNDGVGYLTESGHDYLAEAIFTHFYGATANNSE